MLMTIREVAEWLHVSTKTVYRLINSQKLAPVKIGRATRIEENDVEEYIQSLKKGGRR